jgi:hypothetical protein
VLEEILRGPLKNNPFVGLLGLKETILVAGWYILVATSGSSEGRNCGSGKQFGFLDPGNHNKLLGVITCDSSEGKWMDKTPTKVL